MNKSTPRPAAPQVAPREQKVPEKQGPLLAGSFHDASEIEIHTVEEEKKTHNEEALSAEQQDTTLQEMTGPGADDELLDLWKKDVEKRWSNPPVSGGSSFLYPS